jgi:hypothetical protein
MEARKNMSRAIERLEERRLFTLTPQLEVTLGAPVAVVGSAVRDDGSVVTLSQGSNGVLTLRTYNAAGTLQLGPVQVSGQGSQAAGVGSDRKTLDVDRAGNMAVVYQRAGVFYAQAFSPTLVSLGAELSLGGAAPLDLAVSSKGFLVASVSDNSLSVTRLAFNGTTDFSRVVNTVPAGASANRTVTYDSVSLDTDASDGFGVAWEQGQTLTRTLSRTVRASGQLTTVDSAPFDQPITSDIYVREFNFNGDARTPSLRVSSERVTADAEVELSLDASGNAALAIGTLDHEITPPVFNASTSTFSDPVDTIVGSRVRYLSINNSGGRLSPLGKLIFIQPPTRLTTGTASLYANSSLVTRRGPGGIGVVSFETRTFTRQGNDLVVDLSGNPTTIINRVSASGQLFTDDRTTLDDSVTSMRVVGGGNIQIVKSRGATTTLQAFSQTLIASSASLTATGPTAAIKVGRNRVASVLLEITNAGDLLTTGESSFSAILRQAGQPDVTVNIPGTRLLTVAPGKTVRVPLAVQLPSNTASGTYTLAVRVDANNAQLDDNRTNNTVNMNLSLS